MSGKAKQGSLESKFKLMQLVPFDKRMKRKHILVYGFILDWFHSKYGDALASSRHVLAELKERDPFGQGLYMGDVHSALTELVAWGYLSQEKGAGRRASRYVPVWSIFDSVQKSPNATEDEISVREPPNSSVRETQNATGDSVQKSPNKDPSTPIRSQDPETGKDGHDCAAPVAPPVAPLERAKAETAQGGFEELWKTYFPKRGQGDKKKARAAYEKLAPDAGLHAELVESASAWFEAWAAQGKPDAPRKHLDTWLTDEHYECDPPTSFKPKERKAKTPTPETVDKPRWPRVVDIIMADVEDDSVRSKLKLLFCERGEPKTWEHEIILQHPNMDIQQGGQAEFGKLCRALGLINVTESSELENHAIEIMPGKKGALEYYPAPANDNMEIAA
ncbi:hypothetical protein [Ensifer adhaerens]|uniref:hypothetical protein n=1 Tax=Ensifer adhaerens TaxID=106592 RepID=UPI00098F147C|nr:hypothetical protein [Ensifer adhaerens]